MKVIHCLNHFFPEQIAGTEVYVWKLCKHLQELGCEVSVVLPNYNSHDALTYMYDGLPVFRYGEPSLHSREIVTGKSLPEGLDNFKRHIEAKAPDVVHFHEISGSIGIGVKHFEVAKASGAKVLFTMHLAGNTCRTGTLMYAGKEICDGIILRDKCAYCALVQKTGSHAKAGFISKMSKPFFALDIKTSSWQNAIGTALSYPHQIKQLKRNLQRIIRACDTIIPITNWYHEILLKNGVPAQKMSLVLQALPISPKEEKPKSRKKSGIPKLIFVGRIHWLKGITLLLDAFKELPKGSLQLDIYGAASEADYLLDCKLGTKANTDINWMGSIKPEEVIGKMREYDALILPSMFSEMSPLVIQEAFAAGIPVVGSNVYGIAEQVTDGVNGLLFDFGNKSSLLKLLQRISGNNSILKSLTPATNSLRSFADVATETFKLYNHSFKRQAENQV